MTFLKQEEMRLGQHLRLVDICDSATEFQRDLAKNIDGILGYQRGHDPRNHVGDQVVREVLGEDYRPGVSIGKPSFTRAAAMTVDILSAAAEDSKEVPT